MQLHVIAKSLLTRSPHKEFEGIDSEVVLHLRSLEELGQHIVARRREQDRRTSLKAQHCSISRRHSSQSYSLDRLASLYGKFTVLTTCKNSSVTSSPPYPCTILVSLITKPSSTQDTLVFAAPRSMMHAEGRPAAKDALRPSCDAQSHGSISFLAAYSTA